jgi:hypothetical protein
MLTASCQEANMAAERHAAHLLGRVIDIAQS